MSTKKLAIALGILIIVIIGVGLVAINLKPGGDKPALIGDQADLTKAGEPTGDQADLTPGDNLAGDKSDLIKISNLSSGQVVQSPLIIEGEARGYWFFEASFPVKLYDESGQLIGTAIAQAGEDWMTNNFVPFKVELNFNNSTSTSGTLVLEKDNPSGLPANADELRLPVKFTPNLEKIKVKVFFNNNKLDPEITCLKVFPVEREIAKTLSVARAALTELLTGTTPTEDKAGFTTSLNPNVKIQSLTIEDGVAKVDFDEQLEAGVGGSCRVAAIRAQILETLKQFLSVKNVIISINGRIEDILQP